MRVYLLMLFCCLSLFADSFLNDENHSYQKSKKNPELIVFVTSHVIPLDESYLKDTPYGRVIDIPKADLNNTRLSGIVSRGLYNRGNYTIFRSTDNSITFYRYSRNNSNLYSRMAPNIYPLTNIAGDFYRPEQMPQNLPLCAIIVSRTFEARKTSSPELLLDLDEIPNQGAPSLLLECPKPNEKLLVDGHREF